MDKFLHHKNLKITREDAFDLTQQMMLLAMSRRTYPLFESFGVINDLLGDGLSEKDGLRVERIAGDPTKVKVNAGYAIIEDSTDYNHAIIVLDEDVSLTIEDEVETYATVGYVMIEANVKSVASGKETYMPGRLSAVDSIKLLRQDSYELTISEDLDEDKIVLAKLILDGSGNLDWSTDLSSTVDEITTRPYIDSDDTSLTIANNLAGVSSSGGVILVGDEQIEYSSRSNKVFTLSERGLNDTIANVHRNGTTVTYSPIIDMRQTNAAKLKNKYCSLVERLSKGIIDFGDGKGDRVLKTRKLPDTPNAPTVTAKNIALMWINKQVTESPDNAVMQDIVASVKNSQETIQRNLGNIYYLKDAIAAESDADEQARLSTELAQEQKELIESQNKYMGKSKELSFANKAARADKKYVLSLTFNQPTLVDSEQIIQYEAEIEYLPLVGKAKDKLSNVKNQAFSKLLTPNGIDEYGDKIYTYNNQPDLDYRTIYIPIRENEKVSIKVRSLTEDYMVSDWTDEIEYEFDGLSNSDIQLAIDLDEYKNSQNDILQATLLEMTQLFQQATEDLRNSLLSIQENTTSITALQSKITALEEAMSELEDDTNDRIDLIAESVENDAQSEL